MAVTLEAVSISIDVSYQITWTDDRQRLYTVTICIVLAIVRIVLEWVACGWLCFEW